MPAGLTAWSSRAARCFACKMRRAYFLVASRPVLKMLQTLEASKDAAAVSGPLAVRRSLPFFSPVLEADNPGSAPFCLPPPHSPLVQPRDTTSSTTFGRSIGRCNLVG